MVIFYDRCFWINDGRLQLFTISVQINSSFLVYTECEKKVARDRILIKYWSLYYSSKFKYICSSKDNSNIKIPRRNLYSL